MKSSRIMKVFESYVKKYNMNNINIKTRYFHSLKVMELCRDIATSLEVFTEEEIVLCELIGLFHEIGGFNSTPNFHISESEGENIYNKTIEILFDKGLIREITKDTKYDKIIKFAIYAYDKEGLPENIGQKVKYICGVIRDAHNLDTFRMAINYNYIDLRIDSYPNQMVYDNFKSFKKIHTKVSDNTADDVLAILSNVFIINFKYSYYLLKNNMYINKMIEALSIKDENILLFFKQLGGVLNNYVDRKIGVYNAI